jgi:hypothetical protein
MRELKGLIDGHVVAKNNTGIALDEANNSKWSRFQQMSHVKWDLLKILDSFKEERTSQRSQAFIEDYQVEEEDLDIILEHIDLWQETTDMSWDLWLKP